MLYSAHDVSRMTGLPRVVVSELLYPGVHAYPNCDGATPQFDDLDVMRAQIAARMMDYGVYWHYVKSSIDGAGCDRDDLQFALARWTDICPPGRSQALPVAVVTVMMVLALLVGIIVGAIAV